MCFLTFQAIKKCHKLTERQFIWSALKGRAAKHAWKDCEQIVLAKGKMLLSNRLAAGSGAKRQSFLRSYSFYV